MGLTLLFLVALLFAIPTSGLSLLAYAVYFFVHAYIRARARMHYANERHAEKAIKSGGGRFPSWIKDRGEVLIFIEVVQKSAERHGVPFAFSHAVMSASQFEILLRYAGAMEAEGASFIEQQDSVGKKVVEMWQGLPSEERQHFIVRSGDIPF
ncbi:hypothetical protein [Methylocystis heyeri]|uniref:Uncharacterized protein n=1 Tax=Methylocystis heyeri TaxID=391905 RepID=A0A6B8KEB5_9HYPH|nr:hypothetical protein [Methylocystis heyeri]QGM46616.1 hypothetical protein H2LOC_013435 [Methylocystis heyeri]